ncbi:MMPL family transporter [Nonomuraea insulae]|uniref:MMPL family transporter n=1 Tax=Nonomuraea insulae TaxID=1616787 RepID=A0ABW1CUE4_9ACTN
MLGRERTPPWRGWAVLTLWLVLTAGSAICLPSLMRTLATPSLRVEGSPSAQAAELVARRFPRFGAEQLVLVFDSDTYRSSEEPYQRAMSATIAALDTRPEIASVQPLPAPEGLDPHHAYVLVGVDGEEADRQRWLPGQLRSAQQACGEAVRVSIAGVTPAFSQVTRTDVADLRVIEVITASVVALLLLAGLGAAGAAAVPMLVAGVSILVSTGVLAALRPLMRVDSSLLTVTATICLGLGLDYALLILLRYRRARALGRPPDAAAAFASATAGRTVTWCALAVAGMAACLLVVPAPLIRAMAVAGILAAVVSAAATLTLLPVLLVRFDALLERGRLPWHPTRRGAPEGQAAGWLGWAGHLMRHPWPYVVGVTALLLLAATPALELRPAITYDRAALAGSDVGRAMAQMEADRMAGISLLALPHPRGAAPVDTTAMAAELDADPRVALTAAMDNGRDLTLLLLLERPAPDSAASAALTRHVREVAARLLPPGQQMYATGPAAFVSELTAELLTRLWQVMALVLACSFVLLLIVFRSVLVPLKAIAMNVLSIAAAFGLLTALFQQDGEQINALMPLLTFSMVFALSIDYEVFLVHRIAARYRATGDNDAAIVYGLRHTARPITLAAAAMAVTFTGLMLSHREDLRQLGFAVAAAITIDATLIRMVLVPALMRLLGRRNWWLPRPLARLLPPTAMSPSEPSSGPAGRQGPEPLPARSASAGAEAWR